MERLAESEEQKEETSLEEIIQETSEETAEEVMGTEVKGIISSDTTWSFKNSPYIVVDNIFIEENVTLMIEPKVEVRFDRAKYIQIMGNLKAIGTKDNPIIFTSHYSTHHQRWEIKVGRYREGTKGGNLQLKYCKVEGGVIRTESAAYGNRDFNNLIIDNCIFDTSSIWTELPGKRSYFKYNTFSNSTNAIYINTGSSNPVEISFNNFKGNKRAILIGPVSPTGVQIISNNFAIDNEISLEINTKDNVDVSNNWWGTTDTNIINSKIYDFYDYFGYGKVNYQPIATSEISGAGIQ